MKKDLSIILLAFSIAFSGFWIGNSIKHNKEEKVISKATDVKADNDGNLTFSEAAKYLEISEEKLDNIIVQESLVLTKRGVFHGKMLPYTKVYGEYISTKESSRKRGF